MVENGPVERSPIGLTRWPRQSRIAGKDRRIAARTDARNDFDGCRAGAGKLRFADHRLIQARAVGGVAEGDYAGMNRRIPDATLAVRVSAEPCVIVLDEVVSVTVVEASVTVSVTLAAPMA